MWVFIGCQSFVDVVDLISPIHKLKIGKIAGEVSELPVVTYPRGHSMLIPDKMHALDFWNTVEELSVASSQHSLSLALLQPESGVPLLAHL